ncbi:hypothetical protein H2199_002438 [Coniosporium tulheliwenetii]|uniref:Uncharacterized protein n=1 Tax=Coniosporium tulheliwenetii TaxID=3383036 RepID=A0ACC2ZH93_9PEZI|nr:hypothetical protein H2199_002438 [Cladosporium sp. JES 115]
MFSSSRNKYQTGSFSKNRASKSTKKGKASFKEADVARRIEISSPQSVQTTSPQTSPNLTSAIVTLCVGREQRLFAAHEDVLCHSPYFAALCRTQFFEPGSKRIDLPSEEPEIFSSVLEYLYKGDYYPRLQLDKRRQTWHLEDTENGGRGTVESTVYHNGVGGPLLKDTVIYQGLQSGIQCSTILSSARYAYDNTPDNDAKLRSHYLALIIRSRHTFKRSGTMQNEMENGGKLFFDLFVAMSNHMDDISSQPPRK